MLDIAQGKTDVALELAEIAKRTGFHIINNVGSVETLPLKPADRGFGK